MTLLEDLERNAEENETPDIGILKTLLNDPELLIPEFLDSMGLEDDSHPGSTRKPDRLVFLSEAFVA
jgi:hypothetical protein